MAQPESLGPDTPAAVRPERPLGRGLEDVARVFLTQEGAPPGADSSAGRRVSRPTPRDDSASSALLLRPALRAGREQVGRMLRDFEGAIEEGLRVIDEKVPSGPCGEIDLLAVDRAGRLSIVDFDPESSDALLVRGLGHLDWVAANAPNLRRMFRGQAINFSLPPRLILLAPQLPARLTCAARGLAPLQVAWVRYHLAETPGGLGILFEAMPLE
jgi:hypothetical protein